ncbi:uncharacterized protein TNCV_1889061 [Trichonephila clavipes]|nr:uncharacterized protein TNCV_1889061 [Trichonephila clavipes]
MELQPVYQLEKEVRLHYYVMTVAHVLALAECHKQSFKSFSRNTVIGRAVPSRHGGILNSRRAARTLVRLVEGDERWEAPDHHQGVLSQNWGGTEQNCTVTCMVLKAKDNDRRKNIALSHDEFRGP